MSENNGVLSQVNKQLPPEALASGTGIMLLTVSQGTASVCTSGRILCLSTHLLNHIGFDKITRSPINPLMTPDVLLLYYFFFKNPDVYKKPQQTTETAGEAQQMMQSTCVKGQ